MNRTHFFLTKHKHMMKVGVLHRVLPIEFHGSLLSAAERRGTPVLLSASVSDNSGNSPQIAVPGGFVALPVLPSLERYQY